MTWSLADDALVAARLRASRGQPATLRERGEWYGSSVAFQRGLEDSLREDVEHRGLVEMTMTSGVTVGSPRILRYSHTGVWVPSRGLVRVVVEFHEFPSYKCYGRVPEDYPRVYADPSADSPHRMGDDSLCLYFPLDPRHLTWCADDGLAALFNLAATHLFFELEWRATGTWLGEEAPHNLTVNMPKGVAA